MCVGNVGGINEEQRQENEWTEARRATVSKYFGSSGRAFSNTRSGNILCRTCKIYLFSVRELNNIGGRVERALFFFIFHGNDVDVGLISRLHPLQ